MSKQRANDLVDLNVDIELFPMPKPDEMDVEDGAPYAGAGAGVVGA